MVDRLESYPTVDRLETYPTTGPGYGAGDEFRLFRLRKLC